MDRIATLVRAPAAAAVFAVAALSGFSAPAAEPTPEEHCRWDGTAPICDGGCRSGETQIGSAPNADVARRLGEASKFGKACATGDKALCCTYSCPSGYHFVDETLDTAPRCVADSGDAPAEPPVGVETRRGGDIVVNPSPLQGSKLNKGPIAKPTPTEPPPAVPVSFEGSWSAKADNVNYNILMGQTGNTVVGNFVGADGSRGTFSGNLAGRVLRFAWSQIDGAKGSGKFTLSDDGQSFAGSYNFGQNPDEVAGTWNGHRR
jgi:hypothetical protein